MGDVMRESMGDVMRENGLIPNQVEVKKILKEVHLSEKAPTAQPGLTIENFCVPGTTEGCDLVTVKGSEQAGLTGGKGSVVRKVAIDKTRSSPEKFLAAIRTQLEK